MKMAGLMRCVIGDEKRRLGWEQRSAMCIPLSVPNQPNGISMQVPGSCGAKSTMSNLGDAHGRVNAIKQEHFASFTPGTSGYPQGPKLPTPLKDGKFDLIQLNGQI